MVFFLVRLARKIYNMLPKSFHPFRIQKSFFLGPVKNWIIASNLFAICQSYFVHSVRKLLSCNFHKSFTNISNVIKWYQKNSWRHRRKAIAILYTKAIVGCSEASATIDRKWCRIPSTPIRAGAWIQWESSIDLRYTRSNHKWRIRTDGGGLRRRFLGTRSG